MSWYSPFDSVPDGPSVLVSPLRSSSRCLYGEWPTPPASTGLSSMAPSSSPRRYPSLPRPVLGTPSAVPPWSHGPPFQPLTSPPLWAVGAPLTVFRTTPLSPPLSSPGAPPPDSPLPSPPHPRPAPGPAPAFTLPRPPIHRPTPPSVPLSPIPLISSLPLSSPLSHPLSPGLPSSPSTSSSFFSSTSVTTSAPYSPVTPHTGARVPTPHVPPPVLSPSTRLSSATSDPSPHPPPVYSSLSSPPSS